MKGFIQIFKLAFSQKTSAYLTIVFNLFFVIFNLISLVLFIPFLNLIFKADEDGEIAKVENLTEPDWDSKTNFLGIYDIARP